MLSLELTKTTGSNSPGLRRFFGAAVIFILLWAANGWTQTQPAAPPSSPMAPAPEKILSDLNQALQQQLKEFTEHLNKIQSEYKETQEEAQSLGVAISTHKAALSLDKITLDQAKELQQYYARLAGEKAKAAAALTLEIEKYEKFHSELVEADPKIARRKRTAV